MIISNLVKMVHINAGHYVIAYNKFKFMQLNILKQDELSLYVILYYFHNPRVLIDYSIRLVSELEFIFEKN